MAEVTTQTFTSSNDGLGGKTNKGVYKMGDSYTSYSGCDIIASIEMPKINPDGSETTVPYVLGSLQTISISTYQDKVPVRAIGNMNAIDYTMGPRTIAGSLVFAVFDKHFADNIFNDLSKENTDILVDELPAFNVTITYANEYGSMSRMALYGIRIVEEGQVISINDVYTENTYKYCALSLERLNKKNTQSNNKMGDKKQSISTLYDNDITIDTPGKDIVDELEKENSDLKEESIRLSVETENPINSYKDGIAHFYLRPNQNTGYIHIYNLAGEEIKSISVYDNTSVEENSTNVYSTELGVGSYSAQYKNEIELKYSNIVNFVISKDEEINYSLNDEPMYEYSNDSHYTFASNNKDHDSYLIAEGRYESVDEIQKEDTPIIEGSIDDSNSQIKVELEKPETYYTVFTYKGNEYSKPKTILTEKNDMSLIKRFIEFVKSNRDKLLNNLSEYDDIFDTLLKTYDKTQNIIDNVLNLEDSKYKTELVYYSILFQNYVTRAYNYKINFFVERDVTAPFFNSTIHNNSNKTLFFERRKNKDYFSMSKQGISSNLFLSKYGNRYFTYDVADNNYRSVRYDFTCFSPDDEYLLRKYSNVNTMKDVSVSTYTKNLYKKLEEKELVYAQLKQDNAVSVINLEEPSCEYDYGYNKLIVDVDYREELGEKDNEYYLVFKEAECINDYTPSTKIKFKDTQKTLSIDAFSGLIVRDKYYFVWIEDINTNTISNPTLLSTYEDEVEFIKYIKSVDIEQKINNVIKKMKEKNDTKYESTLEFLSAEEDLNIKNLKYEILESVYQNAEYDIDMINTIFNLMSILLIKQKYIEYENIVYDKENMFIKFNDIGKDNHVVVYKISKEDNLLVSIYDENTKINLEKDGCTIAFVSKNNGIYTSGFVVIDNKSKEYLTDNMKVSVI